MEPARRATYAAATGVGSATAVRRRIVNVAFELATLVSARMGHLPCRTPRRRRPGSIRQQLRTTDPDRYSGVGGGAAGVQGRL
jgi:hypothetical protein